MPAPFVMSVVVVRRTSRVLPRSTSTVRGGVRNGETSPGSGVVGCAMAASRADWLSIGVARAPVIAIPLRSCEVLLRTRRVMVRGFGVWLASGVVGATFRIESVTEPEPGFAADAGAANGRGEAKASVTNV